MAGSKEESSYAGLRTPSLGWSILLLLAFSFVFAYIALSSVPSLPSLPGIPGGAFWTASLIFLIPAFPGTLASVPVAGAVGGKLSPRRALFTGVIMYAFVAAGLGLWKLFSFLHGPYPLEAALLASFGITVWMRQMVMSGISGPTPSLAVPQAMIAPATGVIMVWAALGVTPLAVAEGVLFLLMPLGAVGILIYAANKPMVREFGEGGVAILRPLMDHINERDPLASRRMEEFFAISSSVHDLSISALRFRRADGKDLLWVAPTVHPGPFGELGASDLPHKMVTMLSDSAEQTVVMHAPCTHDQNIPTTEEVQRVSSEFSRFLPQLSPSPARSSPLVSPHAGSLARAQVLGDSVLILFTQAPKASDDVDYSVGEMVREEAQRMGFRHGIVVDAHNVYIGENQGTVPFGSPESFQLVKDARAAMSAARAATRDGAIRVGFSHRRGYTVKHDGLGQEGISVTVVEAGGQRTAYAVLDGNNLMAGFRETLIATMKRTVDEAEVLTTDNHVVHEVANGINPIGKLRSLEAFSADLESLVKEAVSRLEPAELSSGELRVKGVKVMGHGTTTRLMTALNDSFEVFWVLLPTTLVLTLLGVLLVLALFP